MELQTQKTKYNKFKIVIYDKIHDQYITLLYKDKEKYIKTILMLREAEKDNKCDILIDTTDLTTEEQFKEVY